DQFEQRRLDQRLRASDRAADHRSGRAGAERAVAGGLGAAARRLRVLAAAAQVRQQGLTLRLEAAAVPVQHRRDFAQRLYCLVRPDDALVEAAVMLFEALQQQRLDLVLVRPPRQLALLVQRLQFRLLACEVVAYLLLGPLAATDRLQ